MVAVMATMGVAALFKFVMEGVESLARGGQIAGFQGFAQRLKLLARRALRIEGRFSGSLGRRIFQIFLQRGVSLLRRFRIIGAQGLAQGFEIAKKAFYVLMLLLCGSRAAGCGSATLRLVLALGLAFARAATICGVTGNGHSVCNSRCFLR